MFRRVVKPMFVVTACLTSVNAAADQSVITSQAQHALDNMQSPKIVRLGNTFHAAFAKGSKIYRAQSTDGYNWYPQLVSSGTAAASLPAIVATPSGTIVITWVSSNKLQYWWNNFNPCVPFAGKQELDWGLYVTTYDITVSGEDVHIVAGSSTELYHTGFPANQPPAGVQLDMVHGKPICWSNTTMTMPSIAVQNTAAGKEILVAFHSYTNEVASASCPTPPTPATGPWVKKRSGSSSWGTTYAAMTNLPAQYSAASLVLGGPDNNGTFYLTGSRTLNTVHQNFFAKGPASGTWVLDVQTAQTPRTTSIAVDKAQPGKFSLGYTEGSTAATYGNTYTQLLDWSTGPSPTATAAVLVSSSGKNMHVSHTPFCTVSGHKNPQTKQYRACRLNGIFEQRSTGNAYQILSDLNCGPVLAIPCRVDAPVVQSGGKCR